MRLRPLFAALLATVASFPPNVQSRITRTEPTTFNHCADIPPHHTSATILRRKQGSTPKEMSLSQPALTGPSTSITKNLTRGNNATSSTLRALPPLPPWVLTLEDLITANFRIVITALTLFNVSITWRLRDECRKSHVCHHS